MRVMLFRKTHIPITCSCLLIVIISFWAAASPAEETGQQEKNNAIKMTLADAVVIALNNSVDLRSAYLDRIVQRFDLRKAEDKLNPQSTLNLAAFRNSTFSPTGRAEDINGNGIYTATLLIPTGGTFAFAWNSAANKPDTGNGYNYSSSWIASFVQPLLKGGGIDNTTYSIKVAHINEEQNILSLRDLISHHTNSHIRI